MAWRGFASAALRFGFEMIGLVCACGSVHFGLPRDIERTSGGCKAVKAEQNALCLLLSKLKEASKYHLAGSDRKALT